MINEGRGARRMCGGRHDFNFLRYTACKLPAQVFVIVLADVPALRRRFVVAVEPVGIKAATYKKSPKGESFCDSVFYNGHSFCGAAVFKDYLKIFKFISRQTFTDGRKCVFFVVDC